MRRRKTATLLRRTPAGWQEDGTYLGGIMPDPETAPTFEATVAEVKPDEAHLLPEGVRVGEALKLYTREELRTARNKQFPDGIGGGIFENDERLADLVLLDGRLYVVHSAPWDAERRHRFPVVVHLADEATALSALGV